MPSENQPRPNLSAAEAGLIRPVLVGPKARIEAAARELGADVAGYPIVDADNAHNAALKSVELARAAVVVGKGAKSDLVARITTNDEALRMPPEGKTQLTEEEIQILTWWVETGASETATLSQLELTPEVSAALEAVE